MLKNYLKISDCLPGGYTACIYDDGCFIGNVIEVSDQNQDLQAKFMAKSLKNNFNWPLRNDICWVSVSHLYALLFHEVFTQQAHVIIVYLKVNLTLL